MSGIQVSKTQEKLITPLLGYTVEQSADFLEYVTGQNVGGKKRALDVMPHGVYELSTGNLVATGSTTRIIKKVAHGAHKNDFIFFTTGLNVGLSMQILSVPDADNMIIASTFENSISIGDAFTLHRAVVPLYSSNGGFTVGTVAGMSTEAKQDTQITKQDTQITKQDTQITKQDTQITNQDTQITNQDTQITNQTTIITDLGTVAETAPATDTASSGLNGRLQRIAQRITSLIAQIPASLGQTTKSASMSVTIASDQAQTLTSVQSLTLDGTTAQTFSAPANAKWVKIMAGSANTIDLKIAFGGTTATSTVGTEFQSGRSEDFLGVSAISVICKSAITAHAVFITWSV